jgi:hypothetical protein
VNIHYTPPGMTDADSLHLELQAPPGAHIEVHLTDLTAKAQGHERPSSDDWKEAARKIVMEVGTDRWLSTSAIRDRLGTAGIKIGRSALSMELGAMVGRGEIARRGSGPQTEYSTTLSA